MACVCEFSMKENSSVLTVAAVGIIADVGLISVFAASTTVWET